MGSVLGGFMNTSFIALMDYRVRTKNAKDSPYKHHATSLGRFGPSEESNRLYESAPNNTRDAWSEYIAAQMRFWLSCKEESTPITKDTFKKCHIPWVGSNRILFISHIILLKKC